MLVVRCALVLVVVGGAACFESYPSSGTCSVGQRRMCTCDGGGPGWETCYDEAPAIWGACVCNGVPVADAGSDRDVSYRTSVLLDGTHSSDPTGGDLTFHWMIDATPPGSTATLDDATASRPAFVPDVLGDYQVSLTVDDTIATSAPARITISAHNDAPMVVATIPTNVITGSSVTLDASATTDANSDPLAFTWSLTGPPGSTATPANASAATTTFVPDVDGAYQVSVSVDDGRTSSSLSKALQSFHRITTLPFEPWQVDYDKAHDRVIFVSRYPSYALYRYTPATDTLATVALAQSPNAVSVAPDGSRAIVGDNAGITNVNLTTMQITSRVALSCGAWGVVDPGDGWAYVFPQNGLPPYIRAVRLSTGGVATGAQAFYTDMHAWRIPTTSTICASDLGYTEMFTFANGATTGTIAVNSIGSEIWPSDDGTRLFTPSGAVYAPNLTKIAQLPGYAQAISEAGATGTLLVVPSTAQSAQADESIDVYAYPALTYQRSVALPSQLTSGTPVPTHGRWVFLHADGVHYSVVLQLEPLQVSPGSWGVTNL